jgi:hypothetical protein
VAWLSRRDTNRRFLNGLLARDSKKGLDRFEHETIRPTVVSSIVATSLTPKSSTSWRMRAARCRGGSTCMARTNASRMLSWRRRVSSGLRERVGVGLEPGDVLAHRGHRWRVGSEPQICLPVVRVGRVPRVRSFRSLPGIARGG